MDFDYDTMEVNKENIIKCEDKINSSKFNYDNFCGFAGIDHNDFLNKNRTMKEGFEVVGYCDGGKVNIRPRPDSIAVMLYDVETGHKFWFHLYI